MAETVDAAAAPIQFSMIAKARGYTKYTQRHGDKQAARLASRSAAVTREVVGLHQGVLLELRGAEAPVVFGSPRRALREAMTLQTHLVDETIANPRCPWESASGSMRARPSRRRVVPEAAR